MPHPPPQFYGFFFGFLPRRHPLSAYWRAWFLHVSPAPRNQRAPSSSIFAPRMLHPFPPSLSSATFSAEDETTYLLVLLGHLLCCRISVYHLLSPPFGTASSALLGVPGGRSRNGALVSGVVELEAHTISGLGSGGVSLSLSEISNAALQLAPTNNVWWLCSQKSQVCLL